MLENYDPLELAYLRLEPEDLEILKQCENPLHEKDDERPGLHELRLMRQPDYFYWACKTILNVEIIPEQAAILEELWTRPFPMYVASRGFGKLLRPDEKIRVKDGWATMEDIKIGDKVYGGDGKLTNVVFKTELQTNVDMYRITLRDGRTIDCCGDHQWKVFDKNKNRNKKEIVWSVLSTKDMANNFYWERIGEKSNGKEFRYALPINKPLAEETSRDLPLHPYVVGVLLGDGSLTTKNIRITSKDIELIERFSSLLPKGYKLSKPMADKGYSIIREDDSVPAFRHLCKEIGIWGHNSHTKFIPDIYKYASYEQRFELLKGLNDTDGYSKKSVIEYYTVSNKLAEDYLEVARSLGLHCKDVIKESWCNGKRYADCHRISIYTDQEVFSLPRKLEYLNHNRSKQGQSKFDKVFITNIEYIGKGEGYCITVDNDDHTYITKDYIVTHNTFMLAVYCWLKLVMVPNTKIVVAGAAFRQSKFVLDYMKTIWDNAPILRSIANKSTDGMKIEPDKISFKFNGGFAIAIPIGNGDKIRGLRANIIIGEEFACVGRNSLVETPSGLQRIGDLVDTKDDSGVVNINGDIERPTDFIETPLTDVYKITTKYGYSFKCSNIHKVYTSNGWKLAKDLTTNDYLVFDNKYKFPTRRVVVSAQEIDEKYAWLFGLLVSEGTLTNKNFFEITTTDLDLVTRIKNTFPELDFKVYEREGRTDNRGWVCKKSYYLRLHNTKFREFLRASGLDFSYCYEKRVPWSILQSPKEVVIAFLSGVYEGDGSAFNFKDRGKTHIGVAYYSTSEILIDDIHLLLRKLDFVGYKTNKKTNGRKQWLIRLNGKTAYEFGKMLNIPKWKDILKKEFVHSKTKSGIYFSKSKWRTNYYHNGKSISLGSFNTKEGAELAIETFKQSNPSCLKVSKVELLPEKEHLYDFVLPETHSFYGNGFIQHNSHSPDIWETVLRGFTSVSANPVQGVKEEARKREMKARGLWTPEMEALNQSARKFNQSIITGTADYAFKHFAQYWKRYKKIIESRGDPAVLAEIFPEGIPDGFDWRDYSVIRIPYELIPPGFMDEKSVAQAKATIHSGNYLCEYGACVTAETKIITNLGLKPIIDIKIGDLVLTHKGRFMPVEKVTYRHYEGIVNEYKTFGYNKSVIITPNHPFWYGGDTFKETNGNFTNLVGLTQLSRKDEIDIESYVDEFLETLDGNYIYSPTSNTKINLVTQRRIRLDSRPTTQIAKDYPISQSNIHVVKFSKKKTLRQHLIPKKVKLDYNFGLIVGYYAAEGSIGANGNALEFALDEHKDTNYQQELINVFNNVFKIKAKKYTKEKNTVSITVNSKLLATLMSNICPGVSHTKTVNPDILFSNPEFLKGFIRGYWNGDGHINDKSASASSVSLNLLTQVKVALSYFGIFPSLREDVERESSFGGSKTHILTLNGQSFRRFNEIIYEKHIPDSNVKSKIVTLEDGKAELTIDRFEKSYYIGNVYNLEVKEDNSYTLPNATVHNSFAEDSDGFFKRSLIESCVTSENNSINGIFFDARVTGDQNLQYVIGVDPASEADNFTICVLELHPTHTRVVYCWSTNRKEFKKRVAAGLTNVHDFYGFCARKIRDLMRVFPTVLVGIDSQGGGVAIEEALQDPDKRGEHEQPIYRVVDPNKPYHTDQMQGLHILKMINFADAKWTAEANHGMKKDMEDKVLLFPKLDPVLLAIELEKAENVKGEDLTTSLYDSFEDCCLEIEQLKDELSTIVMTSVGNGQFARDRWDTPETKTSSGRKGRLRKDRYSALLIANMLARQLSRAIAPPSYTLIGGAIHEIDPKSAEGQLYQGDNNWSGVSPDCYIGIYRD